MNEIFNISSYRDTKSNYEKFIKLAEADYLDLDKLKGFAIWHISIDQLLNILIDSKAIFKNENGYKIINKSQFERIGKSWFIVDRYEEMREYLHKLFRFVFVEDDRFVQCVNERLNINCDLQFDHAKRVEYILSAIGEDYDKQFKLHKLVARFLNKWFDESENKLLD